MPDGAVHRLITVYALVTRNGQAQPWTNVRSSGARMHVFGPTDRGEREVGDLASWRPSVFGAADWAGEDYQVAGLTPPYQVSAARTYFFDLPRAGSVLVLDLDVGGDLAACILAQRHAFDPLERKTLGGRGLLSAALSQVDDGRDAESAGLTFGQDKHQLLVVGDEALLFPLEARQDDDLDLSKLDSAGLRRLMFKDTDVDYRPKWTPVSFPMDVNGPAGMMVAVWASNTVLAGSRRYGELGRRRLEEMVTVMSQMVAATNRMREIRTLAVRLLSDLEATSYLPPSESLPVAVERRRAALVDFTARLAQLELDLSFGADILRGPGLVWGGRPVERYQETLRYETGFDGSVEVTGHLVRRLSSIIDSLRAISDSELAHANAQQQTALLEATSTLLARTREAKTAVVVFSVVLSIVSCVGLFAALAAVPASSSGVWVAPVLRNGAFAALAVIGAALLGYGLRWASRTSFPRSVKAVAAGLAVPAVVGSVGTLLLAAVLPDGAAPSWHPGMLVFGLVSAVAALFLIAVRGNFGD
jgi:hypothetical protein